MSAPRSTSSLRPPDDGKLKVKGLAFRTVMHCVRELRGDEVYERVLEVLPEDVSEALRYGRVVSSGWYPIDWYRALLQGTRDAVGGGYESVREIGRASIEHDTGLVYRFALKLLSPRTIFQAYSKLFPNYYDTGRIEVVGSRDGFLSVRLTECRGFDRNMWEEITGSAERLLELSGVRYVRTRLVEGGKDGDDFAEVELRWAEE